MDMIIKNTRRWPNIHLKKLLKPIVFSLLLVVFFITAFNIDYIKIELLGQKISITPDNNFFPEPIEIELLSPINQQIKYTIDGSSPTKKSQAYTQPLLIKNTTTLKYAIFNNDNQIGPTQTTDIFIGLDHDLAILSLSTNPENLWDPKTGIYHLNNFEEKGKKWERGAVLSLYEPNSTRGFTKDVKIRLHGAGSKLLPQKSFRVIFGEDNILKYELFPGNLVDEFESIILRNAGGDWSYTHLRDPLMHELIADAGLDLDVQDYRPTVMYLNGEYWGIYNIRERQTQHYLAQKFNANVDEFSIYDSNGEVGPTRGQIEKNKDNDQKGLELYNASLEESHKACIGCTSISSVKNFMDWKNFMDYILVQFHFDNYDWPYNNLKTWRYNTQIYEPSAPKGLDGRFRWLIFDLDVGFGFDDTTVEEMIEVAGDNSYKERLTDNRFPFKGLVKNKNFYTYYLTKYADLLNTSLSTKSVHNKIDAMASVIDSEMPRHIQRWHNPEDWLETVPEFIQDETVYIIDYDHWLESVELLKVWSEHRPDAMRENAIIEFGLDGVSEITVDVNDTQKGYVLVNEINLDEVQYPWKGIYFNDMTITIEAVPKKGYSFVRWETQGIKRDTRVLLNVTEDSTNTAIFE